MTATVMMVPVVKLLNDDSQYYRAKVRIALSDTWTALLAGHYESTTTDGNILHAHRIGSGGSRSGLPEGGLATLEAEAELGLTEAQALNLLHTAIANSSSHFYDSPTIANRFSRVRRYDTTLKIEGQLTDGLQFRSFTGYQHLATQGEIGNNGVPFNILTGDTGHQDEYLSQEFQLLGGENSRFRWVVGAYGSVEKGRDTVLFTVVPALGPIMLSNDDRIKNSNLGAFAQATWEFAPDWHLTGGARYSKDKRRGDLTTLDNGCAVPAPGAESSLDAAQCPRRFEESFQKPVWLASLDYRLNTDTLLYAKVATGYRSGGIQEGGDTLAESFTPFRPETNTEFEAGFKTDLLNHRLRLNVAGYFDKYSDLQQTTNVVAAGGAVAQAVHNAASAHIWGVEVEADAILTNNFSVHLSGAYTHAKYTSFLDLDANGNPIDRSNQPFPVPKSTFGITPRYTFSNGLGHLSAQVDFRWQSKVVLDPAGARPDFVTQGPYGLLNARIAQHIDRWNVDVAVFGTNLTATHYYDQAVNLEDLLGVDDGYPGAPRLFGFEIIQEIRRIVATGHGRLHEPERKNVDTNRNRAEVSGSMRKRKSRPARCLQYLFHFKHYLGERRARRHYGRERGFGLHRQVRIVRRDNAFRCRYALHCGRGKSSSHRACRSAPDVQRRAGRNAARDGYIRACRWQDCRMARLFRSVTAQRR